MKLTEDGWRLLNAPGPRFTTNGTGDFMHDTKVFVKEIDTEERTPESDGPTNYLGVFAAGCAESLRPQTGGAAGAVTMRCSARCPPGSDGYVEA